MSRALCKAALLLMPCGAFAIPPENVSSRVDSASLESRRKEIVPELIPLVKSGLFEMETLPSIDLGGPPIETRGASIPEGLLGERGALPESFRLSPGLPYGSMNIVAKETDPESLAAKVLWNTHAVWWNQKVILSSFDLIHLTRERAVRNFSGFVSRVYPSMLDPSFAATQLFRERIAVRSPAAVSPFTFLSFRFLGSDEDFVWLFSPALRKTRQLTGANRSDSLFRSPLAAEDIFTWSGKVEFVEARVLDERTVLAPFPRTSPSAATLIPSSSTSSTQPDADCLTVPEEALRSRAVWNVENKRFPQALAWIPSSAPFIPRLVWRIELNARDPFSLYGRQILYVDKELMLPLYKIVYNRDGTWWKTVVSGFGVATVEGSPRRFPYPAFSAIEDRLSGESALISFPKSVVCDGYTQNLKAEDFDPKSLEEHLTNDSPPNSTGKPK